MKLDLQRASLFAAVLIAVGGFAFVFRPAEAAIAERYAQLDAARATLEHDRLLVRRLPELVRENGVLERAAERDHIREPRAAIVARFLRSLALTAAHDGVALETVSAEMVSPQPAASAKPAHFEQLPFEVSVRGRYANVIRAVRDVNAADLSTRLTLSSLRDADVRPGERPLLNAAFHVLLLREADEETNREAHLR